MTECSRVCADCFGLWSTRLLVHLTAELNPDEVINRVPEVLREQDEWLHASRQAINAKIRRGMEELERGEGVPEDELDVHLQRLKAQSR